MGKCFHLCWVIFRSRVIYSDPLLHLLIQLMFRGISQMGAEIDTDFKPASGPQHWLLNPKDSSSALLSAQPFPSRWGFPGAAETSLASGFMYQADHQDWPNRKNILDFQSCKDIFNSLEQKEEPGQAIIFRKTSWRRCHSIWFLHSGGIYSYIPLRGPLKLGQGHIQAHPSNYLLWAFIDSICNRLDWFQEWELK